MLWFCYQTTGQMSVCTWNDIACGINYHRLQSSSLQSFMCYMKKLYPPSVSEVELWSKFLIKEVFAVF